MELPPLRDSSSLEFSVLCNLDKAVLIPLSNIQDMLLLTRLIIPRQLKTTIFTILP